MASKDHLDAHHQDSKLAQTLKFQLHAEQILKARWSNNSKYYNHRKARCGQMVVYMVAVWGRRIRPCVDMQAWGQTAAAPFCWEPFLGSSVSFDVADMVV